MTKRQGRKKIRLFMTSSSDVTITYFHEYIHIFLFIAQFTDLYLKWANKVFLYSTPIQLVFKFLLLQSFEDFVHHYHYLVHHQCC